MRVLGGFLGCGWICLGSAGSALSFSEAFSHNYIVSSSGGWGVGCDGVIEVGGWASNRACTVKKNADFLWKKLLVMWEHQMHLVDLD